MLGAGATCTRGPVFPPRPTTMTLILVCGLSALGYETIKLLSEGGWVERFRQVAIEP